MNVRTAMNVGFLGVGIALLLGIGFVFINESQSTSSKAAWEGCECIEGIYIGDYCPVNLKNQRCEE